MGRGNHLPIDHLNFDYEMVYVSKSVDAYNPRNDILEIVRKVAPSMVEVVEIDWACHSKEELGICRNNLLEVRTADNEWSTAVIVRPVLYVLDGRPSQLNLAYGHLDGLATKIFDGLVAKGYQVRVRECGWTSSPYVPKGAVHA